MNTTRDIQAGVPHGSVVSPTLYTIYMCKYINIYVIRPKTSSVHIGLNFDATYIYCTDLKESFVLRKPQRGHSGPVASQIPTGLSPGLSPYIWLGFLSGLKCTPRVRGSAKFCSEGIHRTTRPWPALFFKYHICTNKS
jgi:hypothetical protein